MINIEELNESWIKLPSERILIRVELLNVRPRPSNTLRYEVHTFRGGINAMAILNSIEALRLCSYPR
jgi:hypothetical protein